jgi:hypothetical protein
VLLRGGMSRPSSPASVLTHLACVVMALAAPIVCLACVQVQTGTGTDTSSSSSSGGTSDGGTTATGDSSTGSGTSCGTDPATGVVLCLGTSACPNATIDTSAFPNCGFHQGSSSSYDLECLCNGDALCPVGAPNSCNDVAQLLTQYQSALQVCEQVSTGACLALEADGGGGSSSGGSTTGLSAACQACISSCGTTPACYQSCGC